MTLDPGDEKALADIAKHGFHALHILAEGDEPAYTFSIGFTETLNAPEAVIFGLKRELMHNMLWETFRQLQAGRVMTDGQHRTGLIEGFDCIARPVHPSWHREYLGTAIWHARYRTGSDEFNAFQIFWAGAQQGLFPWEAGCDPFVVSQQPALYLPRGGGLA
jgi:Domain of unknown function (DUF4262)